MSDAVTTFYREQLPEGELKDNTLQAPCPFCAATAKDHGGRIAVFLNPESFFHGYFRCSRRCMPGGFTLHFARKRGLPLLDVPGYDPDREYYHPAADYPVKNINKDIGGFQEKLTSDLRERFSSIGIGESALAELQIGFNGRYLVMPYVQPDGNCYAGRCIHPDKPEDSFWYGDETFFSGEFKVFNAPDIERCENGCLFIIEGEENLLAIKELDLPGIAVPKAADLDILPVERLAWIRTLFVWVNNQVDSLTEARHFATRHGYKVRLIRWPDSSAKGSTLTALALEKGKQFRQTVYAMVREARAFSPFPSPQSEYLHFNERLTKESSAAFTGMQTGFNRLDSALGGLHGINILGGTPKAGKSCFFIQIASQMAQQKVPVIYYDFENGRQKIYLRTLCRLSRLDTEQITAGTLASEESARFAKGQQELRRILPWFRVVTDRKLDPEIMRRHIDFLRHETNHDYPLVIIDSLHKLPFKELSERRTGIDAWLRQLEAIRDELQVSFLVISELTRNPEGHFDKQPHLGSFKGSGDIGYSADNAMVLLPNWDPFDNLPPEQRTNDLWLVASREQTPGRVARYRLDFPFWGFVEEALE